MASQRSTSMVTLFILLVTFILAMLSTPAVAVPPRDRPTSDPKYVDPHPNPVEPTSHVRCASTDDLLECRNRCYTTFGPYSDFYEDCQECCRKIQTGRGANANLNAIYLDVIVADRQHSALPTSRIGRLRKNINMVTSEARVSNQQQTAFFLSLRGGKGLGIRMRQGIEGGWANWFDSAAEGITSSCHNAGSTTNPAARQTHLKGKKHKPKNEIQKVPR
ncbi:hypothetical protein DFH27DRAFT_313540 [Peziza echinospora]|nr:hypothetical protein DFH27DRAFT_313540 [Peziza echinospora]